MEKIMHFDVIPKVLVFCVQNDLVVVSKKISFHNGDTRVVFSLKGAIYFGDFHFTTCVFAEGSVWFHDGMTTGRGCTYEKKLSEFTDSELSTCNGKHLTLVMYSRN
jgi:hypothetical protein